MSRYERRVFFESLCRLRDRYVRAGVDDRAVVMSIDGAIAAAEAELVRRPAGDKLPAEEPKP